MTRKLNLLLGFLSASLFFVAGVITLPQYGINWDTINHLPRGQAYLHYFLTGKKDYSDLPAYKPYWQKPESLSIDTNVPKKEVPTRSYYQSDAQDYKWYMENGDGGHPPLSDILSSVFNRVLFGKLRLINDIDAYRVYSIFLSACLVGLVFFWTTINYGRIAGFVSALSLALYPLFWSESHFNNEKDVPETVYWSFMFFCFWKGYTTKRAGWILLSGIFFGLALGTKFNILFAPLILAPWLLLFLIGKYFKRSSFSLFFRENYKLIISSVIAISTGIFIFVASWPYLWPDPIARILSVFGFYKAIGLTQTVNQSFTRLFGINTYPLEWIIVTTPPIILLLSLVGIFFSLVHLLKEKSEISLLFLLWLIITISRVSWPGMNIYGGVRQIMEYVPALAMLAGIGAGYLFNLAKGRWARVVLMIMAVLLLIYPILKTHPNENVYFNQLIGGLPGAKKKDMPFWGNSFGAAYRQGVVWMNENLPYGAKIAFARELLPNIPALWLRPDLSLHNSFRSGYLKKGEYVIGLIYQGVEETSYFDKYLEKYLEPIYETKVDGVSILKIWENDAGHTKSNFLSEAQIKPSKISTQGGMVIIDFPRTIYLSRLEFTYNQSYSCPKVAAAYVQISEGKDEWTTLPGVMPGEDWNTPQIGLQPRGGKVIIPFAAEKLHSVRIVSSPSNSCFTKIKTLVAYYQDKLSN